MNNKVSSLLFDEPAEMTKIYNYLIANMDYSTCITGIKRRVSYQAFKELLDVPATKGRVSVPSSRAKARAYLKRMDAIGLINDQGDCVYKLAYETPHKTDATRFPRGTHEVIASPASNTNGSGGKFPRSNPEVPTHLTTTTTTTGFFQMFTDWEPLESFANDAKRAGYDIAGKDEALFNSALVDVKYAYMGKEDLILVKRNQIGWQSEIIRSMKYLLKQHLSDLKKLSSGDTDANQGGSTPNKKKKPSQVSQLISRVPTSDAELDRYYAQNKAQGAPAAKHTADFTYSMWRNDLTRWRNDKIREGIIQSKQTQEVAL